MILSSRNLCWLRRRKYPNRHAATNCCRARTAPKDACCFSACQIQSFKTFQDHVKASIPAKEYEPTYFDIFWSFLNPPGADAEWALSILPPSATPGALVLLQPAWLSAETLQLELLQQSASQAGSNKHHLAEKCESKLGHFHLASWHFWISCAISVFLGLPGFADQCHINPHSMPAGSCASRALLAKKSGLPSLTEFQSLWLTEKGRVQSLLPSWIKLKISKCLFKDRPEDRGLWWWCPEESYRFNALGKYQRASKARLVFSRLVLAGPKGSPPHAALPPPTMRPEPRQHCRRSPHTICGLGKWQQFKTKMMNISEYASLYIVLCVFTLRA